MIDCFAYQAGAPVGGADFGAHGFSLRWAASVLGLPSTLLPGVAWVKRVVWCKAHTDLIPS